jgi:hypothetical protein
MRRQLPSDVQARTVLDVLAVLASPAFLPHLDVLHTNLGCIRKEYKDLHMA